MNALGILSCWQHGFTEQFCCGCDLPWCWEHPYTPATCCSPGGKWLALEVPDRNETQVNGRELVCDPEGAWRCIDEPSDPECFAMASYVMGLPWNCRQEILTQCPFGFAVSFVNAFKYPSIRGKRKKRSTKQCSNSLSKLHVIRQMLLQLSETDLTRRYLGFLKSFEKRLMPECSRDRRKELRDLTGVATTAFAEEEMSAARPWVGGRPRIGVIIAMARRDRKLYANTLDMWRCYCAHHGDCELVLEIADFMEDGEYPRSPLQQYGGNLIGKAWNRWYALRRHLDSYEWVFTADPDQFPSRECFGSFSFTDVLKAAGLDEAGRYYKTVIVMRDNLSFHTLNSAGFLIRGGSASRLFLNLLFERSHWYGLVYIDQSAWEQTVLEFLDLWAYVREQPKNESRWQLRSHLCLAPQLSQSDPSGSGRLHIYAQCWHDFLNTLFGPIGSRQFGGSPLVLVHPRTLDFNYVVGNRPRNDPPLFWHLAGMFKSSLMVNDETMLDQFIRTDWGGNRLPNGTGPNEELNCTFWMDGWHQSSTACEPGTPTADCRQGYLNIC